MHPHFRYIDELEEKLGRKDADKKRRKADWQQTVAMTQASTLVQCHTKPGVRDGSMPGASVLMTMRMLDDEKKQKLICDGSPRQTKICRGLG